MSRAAPEPTSAQPQEWVPGERLHAFLLAVAVAAVAFFTIPWWEVNWRPSESARAIDVLPTAPAATLRDIPSTPVAGSVSSAGPVVVDLSPDSSLVR